MVIDPTIINTSFVIAALFILSYTYIAFFSLLPQSKVLQFYMHTHSMCIGLIIMNRTTILQCSILVKLFHSIQIYDIRQIFAVSFSVYAQPLKTNRQYFHDLYHPLNVMIHGVVMWTSISAFCRHFSCSQPPYFPQGSFNTCSLPPSLFMHSYWAY